MSPRIVAPILALGIALTLATSARAGQYTIHNCPASLQPNFVVGPWQSFSASLPDAGGYQSNCTPGNVLGPAVGWYADIQGLNTGLGIILQSPSQNLAIRELRLVWSVSHESSGSDNFAQVITDTGYQMIATTPYVAGATNPFVGRFAPSTRAVEVYSYCSYDASTNCNFPSSSTPVMKVEGMDTTLEDVGAPTATSLSGALASSGNLSGTATLQFTAGDQESGVREAQLLIDGVPTITHSYASECPYASFAACPQTEVDSMTWDTSTVANGEHLVALKITDASGNVQMVDSHAIQVVNSHEGPPPTAGPPPACLAAVGTHTTITVSARHDRVQSRYRHRASLTGHLFGPGRKPIVGGTIEVLAHSVLGDQSFVPLGHAATRTHGQFRVQLPPGTSRSVCLRYGTAQNSRYTAAVVVSQAVSAGVTLALHPRKIEPNGTIILTGDVLGGHISQAGKVVELQVLYFGTWRVFQTVRSKANGQFTSFYSFLGGHGRFAFRARVRGENGYPYALGYSRPATVTAG